MTLDVTVPTDRKLVKNLACYHPLKAWSKPNPLKPGKKIIKFTLPDKNIFDYDEIKIPCGQCIGCRLEYSRQWAVRCYLEAKRWENNYFVTLTYNDLNLPLQTNYRFYQDTGEVYDEFKSSPLVPEHLTKFMKDLRAYFKYHYDEDNIRFFACGEYGSKNLRPHFHILLFNCNIRDLELFKSNYRGDCVYISDTISKIWNKGFITVGELNYETSAYTARYILKKQKGLSSDYYSDMGLIPEFTRMSRDPGIASWYYEQNLDEIYPLDKVTIVGANGKSKRVRPPAYFDRLYEIDDPESLSIIKDKRRHIAEINMKSKLSNTSLNEDDYLLVEESNKLLSISALKRTI